MRRGTRLLGGLAILVGGLYLNNASWLAPAPAEGPKILSHRGVHQTFHREGLTNETCTAEQIYPPTHAYLENTLPSIEEAFRLGADMVEIDIHRTTDGEFAVFHDWTVDCRTEGRGRTIDHSMAELRALDLGYGYTADGGETYPLRGKGVGMMPTLAEVLDAFPGRAFTINAKSNNPADAEHLLTYLKGLTAPEQHFIIAGPRWTGRWRELEGPIPSTNRAEAIACVKSYLAWGWAGHVPETCETFGVGVPLDLKRLYWGWPTRLEQRTEQTAFGVMLTRKARTIGRGTGGIDSLEDLAEVPDNFSGWIMTNRIELIGPAVKGD